MYLITDTVDLELPTLLLNDPSPFMPLK